MKNFNKLILVGLSLALITTSCSIEKRVHNSGYHITWHKVKHQVEGEQTEVAVKEQKNKNFVNTNVESVVASESLKENAIELNIETAQVEKIENKLSQTATVAKEVKTNQVASILSLNDTKVEKSVNSKVIKSAAKKIEKSSKAPMSKGDREMLILILLWAFLGGFAAHRWYAGKPIGWNILFILTAGGCGIWAIFDLVHIIKGDFN